MAKRCESSVFSANQAKIYSEMVEFISACESVEDSMQKIKNSPYYLGPSVALMKDKLEAWKTAALDNDMPELAYVYSQKIDAINADEQEIYVTGYEQTAQNIKSDYLNTMQAFANIFVSYVTYLCSQDQTHKNDILNLSQNFKRPSSNFRELANIEKFRLLIPLNDAAYQKFVADVSSILSGNEISTFKNDDDADIEDDWSDISAYKDKIIEAGKRDGWNVNYEKVKVYAPDFDSATDVSTLRYTFEGQV